MSHEQCNWYNAPRIWKDFNSGKNRALRERNLTLATAITVKRQAFEPVVFTLPDCLKRKNSGVCLA